VLALAHVDYVTTIFYCAGLAPLVTCLSEGTVSCQWQVRFFEEEAGFPRAGVGSKSVLVSPLRDIGEK
jgi:hypothetical protein